MKNDDDNVWNKHFFGKEASNANPVNYKNSVNTQYGESSGLEEFCEKAQMLNLEVMKGMYEAWNDKMWNDAAGLLIWMSHPAYPSLYGRLMTIITILQALIGEQKRLVNLYIFNGMLPIIA